MALGGCHKCIKYLMFTFNFLLWLFGCAVLAVGVWLRVDRTAMDYLQVDLSLDPDQGRLEYPLKYSESEDFNLVYTLAYILIAFGLVIVIITFLGCCGALRESQCMLGTFFVLLFVIFGALVGAGIWAVVRRDSIDTAHLRAYTDKMVDDSVKQYYTDEKSRDFVDKMQRRLQCCGIHRGVSDYNSLSPQGSSPCLPNNFSRPCSGPFYQLVSTTFKEHISRRMVIAAGVAIGIALTLILGMIFSLVLCCAIRRRSLLYSVEG